MSKDIDRSWLLESATFSRPVIKEIQRAAREGIYDIRGFGAKRTVPTFDVRQLSNYLKRFAKLFSVAYVSRSLVLEIPHVRQSYQ